MISFPTLVASLALAGVAAAQGCPQASRFGNTVVSPAAPALLKAGDTLTITTNYTCADQFDIKPIATDYLITVPTNNNGHEPEILLTRRTNVLTIDTFTVTIPHFPVFFAGADYELFTKLTYPVDGTDGNPVFISGGQLNPLNIQATS